MSFQQFGLPASLVRNVLNLGYTQPTPVQTEAIPAVRAGRDVLATAQTGTGKTAAFVLPVLEKLLAAPRKTTGALVLTPTRELAAQVHGVARGLANGLPLRLALVTGGVPEQPQIRALREGTELVVATPGRLLAHLREGAVRMMGVQTLVLDEADQLFDMGFLPDVKRIVSFLPARRQTLLFSAIMPPEVAGFGRALQQNPAEVIVGVQGAAATTVTHSAYPVSSGRKTALLEHLLEQIDRPSVLVFMRTRHGAKRLARKLDEGGHRVAELHGDRSPAQRERALRGFRERKVPILVATNVAARGIDVTHVTHVINYDVPAASEEYVHRVGRTGRAGRTGEALVFFAPEETAQLARIERHLGQRIPRLSLPDFDYGAVSATQKRHGGARPGFNATRRKPSRGQGGRR